MPRHAVFGDYQLLFDMYPKIEFCPFTPSIRTKPETISELGEDSHVDEFRVMCLSADVFADLCELYPATAESLKIQGLRKRKMFMRMLKQQEEEAREGKTSLSVIVYKGSMRAHSKYGDKLTKLIEMEDDIDSNSLNVERENTMLSNQILDPDEQSLEDSDTEL